MRVEYINPFVESAVSVLRVVLGTEVSRGQISLGSKISILHDVAVIVGLVGQVEGRVVLDLDKQTAFRIVSVMNGEEMTEFDEMTNATLTELGNMISGRAVTRLSELGYKFDVTPPAIFVGSSTVSDTIESLIVPIETQLGSFKINVALRER